MHGYTEHDDSCMRGYVTLQLRFMECGSTTVQPPAEETSAPHLHNRYAIMTTEIFNLITTLSEQQSSNVSLYEIGYF